nr:unnamed protein product [Digitaria exilis]
MTTYGGEKLPQKATTRRRWVPPGGGMPLPLQMQQSQPTTLHSEPAHTGSGSTVTGTEQEARASERGRWSDSGWGRGSVVKGICGRRCGGAGEGGGRRCRGAGEGGNRCRRGATGPAACGR